ncbi:DUF2946 family protein [Calidithermus roseus]|uniref:DUF2946 family protein n=1 Tax=Calidithermus roseus TaxID=1644118 RepID=UPI000E64848A|nr:DUF2946 family protein [Calidithermus roseus]
MRPPLPPIARQSVSAWALMVLLLWASSLIPVCGSLISSHPYPHPHDHDHHTVEHSSPQDHKPPASRAHNHLGDCPLCVAHALQVTPPVQAPQSNLALIGLLLFTPVPRPKPVKFLLYFSRAPPRGLPS